MKKILALVLAMAMCLSLCTAALADSDNFLDLVGETYEVTEAMHLSRLTIDENSALTAPEGYVVVVTVDGYLQTIEEGTACAFYGNVDVYPLADAIVSEAIRGASAVYAEDGASLSFENQVFLSYGFISGEYIDEDEDGILTEDEWQSDTTNEYGSKFGMSAGILANGEDTTIELTDVTVLAASGSTSNGVFAANGATVTITDSTVITNNSQGHGLDATFGGMFIVDNCVLRTNGGSSSVLSTDFGGGFFQVSNTYCESNTTGSGCIYAAGSSIFVLNDCVLHANASEAVMNAHNNSVVVLKDCYVYGPEIFDGHQAMPSPDSASGDTTFSFDCIFEAVDNAVIHQQGGVTTHYIINCDTSACSADYAIQVEYESGMGTGKLYVNLWDTELTGDIYCYEGGVVVLNLYEGAVFTGEVIMDGECEVTINVYNGGEYIGEYENVNYIDETVAAPEYTDDTYGSVEWIMNESGLWSAGTSWSSYETAYATYVQPVIVAASANVNGEANEASVVTTAEENGANVDIFDLYIEYMRSQLIEGDEFYEEFSSALDTVHEAGYDETTMPFEMLITMGALGYEDFAAYYLETGEMPEGASW